MSAYRKFIGGITRTQLETSKVCNIEKYKNFRAKNR